MKNKVQKIIDKMRPYIQMHGGDVSLVEISDGIVKLKVSGACVDCSFSDETFNGMIGGMIKEEVPEVKEIIIEN
jgi:Fe-S cluster biogenesis protein NfuA